MVAKQCWTIDDVAQWLVQRLRNEGCLSAREAGWEVLDRFGESFIHPGRGRPVLNQDVVARFRRIVGHVEWSARLRLWCLRV